MRIVSLIGGLVVLLLSTGLHAAPVALTDAMRCSELLYPSGSPPSVNDVTGNNGGATECYGAFDGNDPKNDGFTIGAETYTFFARQETPGNYEGAAGLTVSCAGNTPCEVNASSGTWEFTPTDLLGGHNFLIVLKQASSPGYAVWQFANADADSWMGDWNVAWGDGISHLTVYKGEMGSNEVPAPATFMLFALGLAGLRLGRRGA